MISGLMSLPDYYGNTQNYQILDYMLEGCAIIDTKWIFIYVNNAFALQAQLTKEEIIGKTIFQIFVAAEESPLFQSYKVCMNQKIPQQITAPFIFPDGSNLWFKSRSIPIPEGILITSIDVTPQKLAEDAETAQLKSEERFRTLADNMSQLAWMANDKGEIYWYNKRWYDYTGTTFDNMVDEGWKSVHRPDYFEKVSNKFNKAIHEGSPWEDIFPIKGKDQKFRWFLSRALPVLNEDGKIISWFGTNTDITEQKKLEEDIENAYKEIKERLDDKEVLIRELYHRTKNNMQVISSLMGLKAASVGDEKLTKILEELQKRIYAIALVHEMLYKSKNLSRLNLADYIKELVQLLLRSFSLYTNKVTFDYQLDDIYVLIDTAIPCGLVITELVLNSLKYAFPDNKKGYINILLKRRDDNSIELVVSDNGVGVKSKDLENEDKLGLQLFRNIAEKQLDAKITSDFSGGVSWSLNFRDVLYKERV